jgi:purine-nucleoside phosphorylase
MSTVDGHKGELIYCLLENTYPLITLSGRLHFYEGYEPDQVILPIRVLGLLGITTIILTNASGAIKDNFFPGELMVIADHINFTGHSPLLGKNLSELGPRFVDMTQAYDPRLIAFAKKAAVRSDITMHEGVYAGLLGPTYETPAEVQMLKFLGADAVGMSTVFETIAARHMGLNVLAISCLTNKAAGLSSTKISHQEVIENNAKVASKLGFILSDIVKHIGDG